MGAGGHPPVKEDKHAFTAFTLRVNVGTAGWQKSLSAVLSNIQEVKNFKMHEDGRIEISGMVEPSLFLKILTKAGKHATLSGWQFGQCSSNLYVPEYREYNEYGTNGYHGAEYDYYGYGGNGCCSHGGYGGHGDNRYLYYEGYGDRPPPKIQYQHFHEPPATHGKGPDLGGDGFLLEPVPPAKQAKSSEAVNCCSLM